MAAALLSGLVSGAAVGVFGLGILGPLLVTVPNTNRLRAAFPDPSNWVMVGLAVAFAGQAGCAILGLVLGAAFHGVRGDFGSGLGSPNWVFTLCVICCATAIAVVAAAFLPAHARRVGLVGLIAAGCYGWMLPHLAATAA